MNARIPIPALAKKIGVSRQVAEYRLNKMIREGTIQHVRAVYDHSKLGQNIYRVLFQLYQSPERNIDDFVHYLVKNYKIMWAARLGNGWDLVVNFVAKDIQTFDDQFMKLANENKNSIQQYHILTYVNITDCHRGYYTGKKEETIFKHEMRGPAIKLDDEDKTILKMLGEDCRTPNMTIGNKVRMTGNAIRYRIRRYEKEGLLLGYRTIPNPTMMGRQNNLVLLTINNLSKTGEKSLYEYLTHHQSITFIVKHVGTFRIAFEIETRTTEELENTIREIRTTFHEIVSDVRAYPVLKEYTAKYDEGIE